jgi:hypothetical protein
VTATCLDCHRPLKDPASIARQRGRYCQEIFEGDTHIAPKPRRPARMKRLAVDEPFPDFLTERATAVIENSEAAEILAAARNIAPEVDPGVVRTIVVAAMNALDGLIAQAHEDDIEWPTEGDLLLIFTA